MASAKREYVKVVFISTQYVATDPLSFKSVVQNLTGKDSCVSWAEESSFSTGTKRKREPADSNLNNGGFDKCSSNQSKGGPVGGGGQCGSDWKLSKGLSFKELDRILSEMPPMEEWYQLLAQNNLL